MVRQQTLKRSVQTAGVGLHTGVMVNLTLRPAPADSGIVYRRVDLNPVAVFSGRERQVQSSQLCTCLVNRMGVKIATIEHLSAALLGMGIDNVVVEVGGPEIPIMDGSADPFVDMIFDAGIESLELPRKFLKIEQAIRVEEEDRWVELTPYNGFCLDFAIDFNHPVIKESSQNYRFNFSRSTFVEQISRARTFGFMRDVNQLQSKGLCLGGSLACAIVLDDKRVLNEDGLRFNDEFVRHKILDAIGDLSLCGHPILGFFRAFKSGHSLNSRLVKEIFARKDAWKLVSVKDDGVPVPIFSSHMVLSA